MILHRLRTVFVVLVVGVGLSANVGQATIVQTNSYDGSSQQAFPVSNSDLIEGLTPAATTGSMDLGASFGTLNDGSAGATNDVTTGAFSFNPWSVTYNLTGSATGYDLSAIHSIAAWNDNRISQLFDIQVKTVANPTFHGLGTYQLSTGGSTQSSPFEFDANNGSTQVALAADSGLLATGVTAISFSVSVPQGGTATVYREFDVFGSATLPEPASVALLGVAALVLVAAPRRRSPQ